MEEFITYLNEEYEKISEKRKISESALTPNFHEIWYFIGKQEQILDIKYKLIKER